MSVNERHVKFLRNEPRSKVELLFVKDGWTKFANSEDDQVQDCYILRVWTMKGTEANTHEIRLRKSEIELLGWK